MHDLFAMIDQLDLAAQQLHQPGAPYARFSLILTDNIIELILHRTAQNELQSDAMWPGIKSKYTDKDREALGQYFDPKLRFCHKIGWVNGKERMFIQHGHEYRDVLYHVGVQYNEILHNLAWHYHEVGCDLFSKYRQGGYELTNEELTPTLQKHIGAHRDSFYHDERGMQQVADSLKAVKPKVTERLATTLSASAVSKVREFEGHLQFLFEDGGTGMTELQILQDLEFRDFVSGPDSKVKDYINSARTVKQMFQRIEKQRPKFKPQTRALPTKSWKRRAASISNDTDPFSALNKYENLKAAMKQLSRLVQDFGMSLQRKLDLEFDESRGN